MELDKVKQLSHESGMTDLVCEHCYYWLTSEEVSVSHCNNCDTPTQGILYTVVFQEIFRNP